MERVLINQGNKHQFLGATVVPQDSFSSIKLPGCDISILVASAHRSESMNALNRVDQSAIRPGVMLDFSSLKMSGKHYHSTPCLNRAH